jgi:hypothetical protein
MLEYIIVKLIYCNKKLTGLFLLLNLFYATLQSNHNMFIYQKLKIETHHYLKANTEIYLQQNIEACVCFSTFSSIKKSISLQTKDKSVS